MAAAPNFNKINVTDDQTVINGSLFNQLQTSIVNYGAAFLPLTGGQMTGQVMWAQTQAFPGAGVTVSNPSYPHGGIWRSVADHIADATVHQRPGPPLTHAASHQIGGADPIFGSLVGINPSSPSISVQQYIDTAFISATAAATTNYAPASLYSLSGSSPLYATLIAVSSASGSTSIKSYVDSQYSALTGSYPASPSFSTVTVSASGGKVQFTTSPVWIVSQGSDTLKGDGTNLSITAVGNAGTIGLGTSAAPGSYGTFSSNGYVIGSTSIGPNGATIAGNLTTTNDITIDRGALSEPGQGAINFGLTSGALISYNADIANSFYVSKPIEFGASVGIAAGQSLTIGTGFSLSSIAANNATPGVRTDGTSLYLYSKETGSLNLGFDNNNIVNVTFGPDGIWGSIDSLGMHFGSAVISASGASLNGALSINAGYTPVAGDIGISRSAASAQLNFGQGNTSAYAEYGVAANGYFSFGTKANGVISQIKSDGSYLTGNSAYGPTNANVNGIVAAQKSVQAQSGVSFAGISGFTFSNQEAADTGMFSTGEGDLRFFTAGIAALAFQNGGSVAAFSGNVSVNSALSTGSFSSSGAAIVNGSLTVNGTLYAGQSAIQKFRIKGSISLGFFNGATATANTYPNIVIPAYAGGQVEGIRLSALTADTTETASSWNILKNGVLLGTISLTGGAKTAFSYPITNPAPIVAGDQFQTICTTAGTSTGVTVSLEISQLLY